MKLADPRVVAVSFGVSLAVVVVVAGSALVSRSAERGLASPSSGASTPEAMDPQVSPGAQTTPTPLATLRDLVVESPAPLQPQDIRWEDSTNGYSAHVVSDFGTFDLVLFGDGSYFLAGTCATYGEPCFLAYDSNTGRAAEFFSSGTFGRVLERAWLAPEGAVAPTGFLSEILGIGPAGLLRIVPDPAGAGAQYGVAGTLDVATGLPLTLSGSKNVSLTGIEEYSGPNLTELIDVATGELGVIPMGSQVQEVTASSIPWVGYSAPSLPDELAGYSLATITYSDFSWHADVNTTGNLSFTYRNGIHWINVSSGLATTDADAVDPYALWKFSANEPRASLPFTTASGGPASSSFSDLWASAHVPLHTSAVFGRTVVTVSGFATPRDLAAVALAVEGAF